MKRGKTGAHPGFIPQTAPLLKPHGLDETPNALFLFVPKDSTQNRTSVIET